MKLLVFGGTGFIGKNLIPVLVGEGYDIILFSRSAKSWQPPLGNKLKTVTWDARTGDNIREYFTGSYGVINLAGAGIGDKLWTKNRKDIILTSRTRITGIISGIIQQSTDKPQVLIQGSAVGYYGSRPDMTITEQTDKGYGFLSDVVDAWERAVAENIKESTRVVYLRTGVVLGKNGGIFQKLMLPFRFFAGGYPGNGTQWFPWIHIQDVSRAIAFLVKTGSARGIYNLSAPETVQMKTFYSEISKKINKPVWLAVPEFILKLIPGGMGNDLLLTSQRVIPSRLIESGFQFYYPDVGSALNDLLNKKETI